MFHVEPFILYIFEVNLIIYMKIEFIIVAIALCACGNNRQFANVSDSLFVNPKNGQVGDIAVWQYGHELYTGEWEIKKHKTNIKAVGFCESKEILEKEFYNKSTSFIGICLDVDTIHERHFGDRPFYKIKLNKRLKLHNSGIGCYNQTMYGDYYILAENITTINKDSIFK